MTNEMQGQGQMVSAMVTALVQSMPDAVFTAEVERRGLAGEVLKSVSSGKLWAEMTRRRTAGDELLAEILPSEGVSLRGTSSAKLWEEVQIRLQEGNGMITNDLLFSVIDLAKIPAEDVLDELSAYDKAQWANHNLDSLDEEKLVRWAEANLDSLDSDVLTKWVEDNFDYIEETKLVEWANDHVDRLDEDLLIQWAEDNVESLSERVLVEWAVEHYDDVIRELEADAMQSVLEQQEDSDLWDAISDKAKYRKIDFSCLSREEAAVRIKELAEHMAKW